MDSPHGSGLGASERSRLDLGKRRGEATLGELESGVEVARETVRSHLGPIDAPLTLRIAIERWENEGGAATRLSDGKAGSEATTPSGWGAAAYRRFDAGAP